MANLRDHRALGPPPGAEADRSEFISDINVTPFVDVMLVPVIAKGLEPPITAPLIVPPVTATLEEVKGPENPFVAVTAPVNDEVPVTARFPPTVRLSPAAPVWKSFS